MHKPAMLYPSQSTSKHCLAWPSGSGLLSIRIPALNGTIGLSIAVRTMVGAGFLLFLSLDSSCLLLDYIERL